MSAARAAAPAAPRATPAAQAAARAPTAVPTLRRLTSHPRRRGAGVRVGAGNPGFDPNDPMTWNMPAGGSAQDDYWEEAAPEDLQAGHTPPPCAR